MANRRRVVFGIACVVFLGVAAWLGTRLFPSKPTVNVLFITLDTTRADHLGCYGDQEAATPAIDSLATEGVLFEQAYSPAPLTLPSHATMFTGLYPPEHGLRTNGRGRLDESIPTLPAVAAAAGYDTGAFVASFVVDSKFGLDRGFAVYDDQLSPEAADEAIHRQRDGKIVVDAALEWLKQPREDPFFCWVHLYDPHFPYVDRKAEFGERFAKQPYDGEIAYMDQQIGRLLAHLTTQGLNEKTLVVVVGDHGEGLGEHVERTHGYTLYNSTQHVPLLFRWPGRISAGHRVQQTVPLADLTPTLIDLLGLKSLGPMSGQSLRTALVGKPIEDRLCFSATDDPFLQNGWSPLQSVVLGNWKFIRTTQPELYDLKTDRGELKNQIENSPAKRDELSLNLDEFLKTLVPRKTTTVQLSAEERRALESLGYLGGGSKEQAAGGEELPDVKEMLPFDVATEDAQELLQAGKIDEAIEKLRAIVAKSPAHLSARIFLGEALLHQANIADAISQYEAVLKLKPDSANGLIHLGVAYTEQGRMDEAIAQFDKAVQAEPESAAAHYNLGLALAKLGRIHEAIAHYREAILHDEAFPDVQTALGNALISLGQTEEALACFRQELKISPRAVDARVNLAVLLSEKDPAAALNYLREAVEIRPASPQAQYNLGAFLILQHKPKEAIAPLTEALRLKPDHPRAKAELQKARQQAGE